MPDPRSSQLAATGEDFEKHRDHLMAVAYRMLGSRSEAEDAVQETWLRYASTLATDGDPIRDPRAWLTTTAGRICLDMLRSARVRRESYVGPWLPEPVVSRIPGTAVAAGGSLGDWVSGFAPDPAERAARTDEVSLALLVVLERLTPEQRVAFVLHDVFAVPFEEIATALSTSPAAARQLASRARRTLAEPGAPRHATDPAEQRRVVAAFLNAVESGDIDGLLAVLAPDAMAIGDGGGVVKGAGRRPIVTSDKVARFLAGLFGLISREGGQVLVEPVLVNGELGVLFEVTYPDREMIRLVMGLAVADGRITGIFNQLNPAKLSAVPPADPDRSWRPSS